MPTLKDGWKKPRKDKRVSEHWSRLETKRPLNSWEKYQKQYNFIEVEYGERPSNNGLDLANPGFAFTTNLARYIDD